MILSNPTSRKRVPMDSPEYDDFMKRRFLEQVEISPSGCWEWQGHITRDGYSRFSYRNVSHPAHRIAQLFFRNGVPKGLTVDHLCKNRKCVNPLHHEIVTQGVNNLRGNSPSAINRRKQFCKNGHPFTPENTYIHYGRKTQRTCRICGRANTRAYLARKKQKAVSGDGK